jgi:nucleoid DNA-binding protein
MTGRPRKIDSNGVETGIPLPYPYDMPLVLKDLVRRVAKVTRLRNHEARIVVDRMLEEVLQALVRDEKVFLRGLGTFEPIWVQGRKGRDWKTGTPMALPKRRRVAFRPGRSLRPQALPDKVLDRKGQVQLFGMGFGPSPKTRSGRKSGRSVQRKAGEKP